MELWLQWQGILPMHTAVKQQGLGEGGALPVLIHSQAAGRSSRGSWVLMLASVRDKLGHSNTPVENIFDSCPGQADLVQQQQHHWTQKLTSQTHSG